MLLENTWIYNWFPLLSPITLCVFIIIIGILSLFQVFVWVKGAGRFPDLRQRLLAWWYIIGLFFLVCLTRQSVLILFWMGISFLALREYLSVIPKLAEHRRVRLWLYLSIPIHYIFILTNSFNLFLVFIPVYVYLLLPVRMIIVGTPQGFLQGVGSMFWGIMMACYSLSYVAYLVVFSSHREFKAGPLGLMLFLLFVTEINDASQYIWGKIFGKHKIVPKISPKKTLEGFLGGVLTSVVFSLIFGPLLTPMEPLIAILVGILIGVGGFLGDVTLSALKRDVEVKDFGKLLPGHGGLLDRIDSLIFTAPFFFYIIYWRYG